VILSALLEHLLDPLPTLQDVAHVVVEGGLLFVEVPDVEGFASCARAPFQEFSIEHINYFSRLSLAGIAGRAGSGSLIEIDKDRQVLMLVHGGRVQWVFNTSTGSGQYYLERNQKDGTKWESGRAVTPSGKFKIYRQKPEGWWEGDLGKIYRPKYFNGGIAVHGMTSIPNHPASHGCVRLSTMAMDMIWDQNLIPLHTTVWVHD